tara:strand:+ start:472 stop:1116 length:645 start_codon:yes stop_codon:yes gene_type:complete
MITTDWREILENISGYPGIWRYECFIKTERDKYSGLLNIYPEDNNVFRCFNYFNWRETKVIILGQDPYHGDGQANGLAFSVDKNISKPPSLKNIEKELGKEADIESWAKQGVLMLNVALTVIEKKPESHMKFWKPYTLDIINYINSNLSGVVFVAWGGFALKQLEYIDKTKHTLLVSSHPSPLGAHKRLKEYPAFIGSNIFNKINENLEKKINF